MNACPLVNAQSPDGKDVIPERTPTGWYLRAAAGLAADLRGFADGILCRIEPGPDKEVVQLGIGHAASRLCNAIYSPRSDTAVRFGADGLELTAAPKAGRSAAFHLRCTGPLSLNVVPNYMRVARKLPWFTPLDRRKFPRPPAGWCSWYYYYLKINEKELVRNVDWLAEHLKPFGCEWVQIDDGWQGVGENFGSNRDWFVTCRRDFPRGMKWCADYIRAKGLRPGIWCIPFTQSDTELHAREPALFVHAPDGRSPGERTEPLEYEWMPESERWFEWAGRYYIDPTGEQGQRYLRRLFEMLCDEWGYDYVKIDAQGGMAGLLGKHRPQLSDPSLDGDRAYRRGLEAAKAVMGPGRFLLNCGHGFASCGLCDGIRIGGDVGLNWAGMQPAIRSTMDWLFLNTIAFYTDPDVACVRPPLPCEQARLWATLLAVTGQLLMASDKMDELPDERVELLRRIFPVADIHPMELYPLDADAKPGIFDLKIDRPGVGRWDVVALFNWSESEPRTFELSPERLGLAGERWICLDAWSGELLHHGDGRLALAVAPASSRTVTYWPDLGRPQVVGTSRHLTQGAVDLDRVSWDGDRLRLSGRSRVVGGDPYRIRLFVPPPYRVLTRGLEQTGPLAERIIRTDRNRKVSWRIDFARA